MLRLILFLAVIIVLATGFSWLADRPGDIIIDWEGYRIETNVFRATILFAISIVAALVGWSLLRHIWESPAAVGRFFQRRRQGQGLDALSSGMIAIGSGDRDSAVRYAVQARKALPNEPLTHLLRAQAAQLTGDKATSRRIFEAMLGSPDTEQLGLRGLFLEAMREEEEAAALQFAERAVNLNPKLAWAVTSLFDLQCKHGDWQGALDTLAIAKRHGHVEKASAERRRAVLLTAQAQAAEDTDPERALNLSLEAHGLAPDLIPAGAIAGRMLASRGNTPRAARIIEKTWKTSPHPDLSVAYAYARIGDSPRDRLERVRKLATLNPHSIESPIAVAASAIEAKDFPMARNALKPLLEGGRLTQRVCTLMARIEGEEHGNKGRVREWLARAVNAPRDPAWTADGVVSEHWAPVSPVTGALDAFRWRVPVETADKTSDAILASRLEELVALGGPGDFGAGVSEPTSAAKPAPVDERDVVDVAPVTHGVAERSDPKKDDGVTEVPKDTPAEMKAAPRDNADAATPVPTSEVPEPKREASSAAESEPARAETSAKAVGARQDQDDSAKDDAPTPPLPDVPLPDDAPTKPETHVSKKPAAKAKPAKKKQAGRTAKGGTPPKTGASKGRAGDGGTRREAVADTSEPKIFVSPRAPDDPGPDASLDLDDGRPKSNPYRRITS